ncbi:MAG: pirin family protein [Actinomycetota bacterium]
MTFIRRAAQRFESRLPGVVSRHSFSTGAHYDPANTHFGLLVANDEHLLDPGYGFDSHRHRDLEIVTWVLDGTLHHVDGVNGAREVALGAVQYLGAGVGIDHAEHAGAHQPARFVQMWLQPETFGAPPHYEQLHASASSWLPLVSGRRLEGIPLPHTAATLWLGRFRPGTAVELPVAPFVHVFVTRGSVDLEGAGVMGAGDAARVAQSDGQRITGIGVAEVLVWEMHTDAMA